MDWLAILSAAVSFILFVICFGLYLKIRKLEEEYYNYISENCARENKLSMVEYHLRNYKEGTNIYTVMRNLLDLVYSNKESE